MINTINNSEVFSIVCGGKVCRVVITLEKPGQFNFKGIKNVPGTCSISGDFTIGGFENHGGSVSGGQSVNMHFGKESLVCDCKDTYEKNEIILKYVNGTVFKKNN